MKKFLRIGRLTLLILAGVLILVGVFMEAYTLASGYEATPYAISYFKVPSPYSYTAQVNNTLFLGIFIPNNSGSEWSAFLNHTPFGVSVCAPVTNGYWKVASTSCGGCSCTPSGSGSCCSGTRSCTQSRTCTGISCGGNPCSGSATRTFSETCSVCAVA